MIRPELQRGLRIWAEPVIWFLGCFGLVGLLVQNGRASPLFLGAIGLLAIGCGVGLYNAVMRARLRTSADGAGVVLVDEGRIGHFGPDRGGFVELDALRKVSVSGSKGARVWCLEHEDDLPVQIPQSARDADQLVDFLVTLDGVTPAKIFQALGQDADEVVWEREHDRD